jgi:hypothetical protein
MYRKQHNGQLSIEEFYVPFGGTLDPENRWVLLSALMPWEELEETYAPQFSPTVGAPAKPVRLAFGALFIKQRLGLTDEETVHQIQENAYMGTPEKRWAATRRILEKKAGNTHPKPPSMRGLPSHSQLVPVDSTTSPLVHKAGAGCRTR